MVVVVELPDQRHVAKDVGVAGEVEAAIVRETQDVARGLAAVALPGPALEMVGHFGCWRHDISPRHAEILFVLATFRDF